MQQASTRLVHLLLGPVASEEDHKHVLQHLLARGWVARLADGHLAQEHVATGGTEEEALEAEQLVLHDGAGYEADAGGV